MKRQAGFFSLSRSAGSEGNIRGRKKYKLGRIFGMNIKVLGADILLIDESKGYFGDPGVERRTK